MALTERVPYPASRPRSERPIDMAHLATQTMGDRKLEQEVLSLFSKQALTMRDRFASADPVTRKMLAHTLKGSARSMGAFNLADCLAEIEAGSTPALKELPGLIDEMCNFVAAISR